MWDVEDAMTCASYNKKSKIYFLKYVIKFIMFEDYQV